jgi:hypothetical protein
MELAKCTRLRPEVVYSLLYKLEETGIMVSKQEDINDAAAGLPPRTFYYPAESKDGRAFLDRLGASAECSSGSDTAPDRQQ